MLIAVTVLTLLTGIPYSRTILRTCVPNTQFLLNGRLCNCNSLGQSNDASCLFIERRETCRPGQIIWEGCRQCICQENGNLMCTNTECAAERIFNQAAVRSGSAIWCTPFRSYYINCTLCVCPASGKMFEARCSKDSSCILKGHYRSLESISQNICIPKVMYLFTCLQCLCSDDGTFVNSQCVETCHKLPESTKRCIPKSFYKLDCNICRCPETGVSDSNLCSKSTCTEILSSTSLNTLKNKTSSCVPGKFTKPKCIYCECNSQGHVNEQICMEQECLKIDDFKYDTVKTICSAGEMIPTCMECFCPQTKLTALNYCTSVCSHQNKLAILEDVLKEKSYLINRTALKETIGTDSCEPNSLYLDQGRYCLCSEDGNTSFKYCTSVLEYTNSKKLLKTFENNSRDSQKIVYNSSCEPNTYIEFGCNFCYCTKSGKIEEKWCTNDNCGVKNMSYLNLNSRDGTSKLSQNCVSGSVIKIDCNFCICGNSGLPADNTCTKNICDTEQRISEDINCEPSSYYTVDCNICLCPSDGVKNLEKCTKNQCEINFLRSDICYPGELFTDDCNICICPPNGRKQDKICTNRTCSESDTLWKNIFQISHGLLGRQVRHDSQADFQPCFPGEQFEMGCKVCLCPEVGLKAYAICSPQSCNDESTSSSAMREDEVEEGVDHFKEDRKSNNFELPIYSLANRRYYVAEENEHCQVYNLTESSERTHCTPGSEYIIRCRICICPYMGSISQFCRPMPPDRYCEEAYPGYNFVPMGRRNKEIVNVKRNVSTAVNKKQYPLELHMPHNHTKYKCDQPGRLQDDCYICDCKNSVIIEEHCFRSDADKCTDVKLPKFIQIENKLQ